MQRCVAALRISTRRIDPTHAPPARIAALRRSAEDFNLHFTSQMRPASPIAALRRSAEDFNWNPDYERAPLYSYCSAASQR